jgi:hypothetical protein
MPYHELQHAVDQASREVGDDGEDLLQPRAVAVAVAVAVLAVAVHSAGAGTIILETLIPEPLEHLVPEQDVLDESQ